MKKVRAKKIPYKKEAADGSITVYNSKSKKFYHTPSGKTKRITCRGITNLLSEYFWPTYDYAQATRAIKKNSRALAKEQRAGDLVVGTGQEIGSHVHQQLAYIANNLDKFQETEVFEQQTTHLYPHVKTILKEIGTIGVQLCQAELVVCHPEIQLATAIDIIGKRANGTLVLMEMKVGYVGGAWNCSNDSMHPRKYFADMVSNSPFHQACFQLVIASEMMLRSGMIDTPRVDLIVVHVVNETKVILESVPAGFRRAAEGIFNAMVDACKKDELLGRPAKRKTLEDRMKKLDLSSVVAVKKEKK